LLLALGIAACADREPTAPAGPELKKVTPPPADADLVALGKAIFFDENLSLNANQSCATCHDPNWGWTGPNASVNAGGAVYEGSIAGAFGGRKPPTSAYATVSPIFHFDGELFIGGNFWDGRATGETLGSPAAEQALGPFLNPMEQALAAPADVVSLICADGYGGLLETVWGDFYDDYCDTPDPDEVMAAYHQVGYAVAAFEGSPESNAFTSKYDQSLRGGGVKLTREEQRGLSLFKGKGKCTKCHTLGQGNTPALFTDFSFDNLGIPENPANPRYPVADPGLGGFLLSRSDYADMAEDEMGKHKVPTLRNVDLRPDPTDVKAYGHNGYFKSLWEIVHFYNTRDAKPVCAGAYTSAEAIAADCWPAPEIADNENREELGDLGLSLEDEMAIVAFLRTLSDGF
jgi:cytochrome c peroxidase